MSKRSSPSELENGPTLLPGLDEKIMNPYLSEGTNKAERLGTGGKPGILQTSQDSHPWWQIASLLLLLAPIY
jgi:hypothetical protein